MLLDPKRTHSAGPVFYTLHMTESKLGDIRGSNYLFIDYLHIKKIPPNYPLSFFFL